MSLLKNPALPIGLMVMGCTMTLTAQLCKLDRVEQVAEAKAEVLETFKDAGVCRDHNYKYVCDYYDKVLEK